MYHSITIGDKNTFDDWHLIAPIRPSVSPPEPKLDYVDILGRSGSLDYTEALTKAPRYSDRQGSWEFIVLNPGDLPNFQYTEEKYKYDWAYVYSKIMEYLHGKYFDRIVFDDDPEYTYKGRLWVNDWKSNSQWSQIVINYRLSPFKYKFRSRSRSNTISFGQGTILPSRVQTVTVLPKEGQMPSPLHFYITSPGYDEGEHPARFISVSCNNLDIGLQASKKFSATIYLDDHNRPYPKDLNRDIAVPEMVVSNLNNKETILKFGPRDSSDVNIGPINIEYWWEEASL